MKQATLSGIGLGLSRNLTHSSVWSPGAGSIPANTTGPNGIGKGSFIPRRVSSWWCTLDDILWPQKSIVDRIKKRADDFAAAGVDTAINFGFHMRFDFSNYFGKLHGYYGQVCEELHRNGIRFMDHYSCNNVERPRGTAEEIKLNRNQRHHVLLYPDPIAAKFAQYEGHFFQDLCEVDLVNGGRGYARQYQTETFCHNNPAFLEMHHQYLNRLFSEVPLDGIEVDDMCDYAGLTTCGCKYCRERFKKDYGHEIPIFGDKSFWGNTAGKGMLQWGNYESPVFRDWIRMKSDTIVDHLKMIRTAVRGKPLMTCCSSAGPIVLNAISLHLEQMAPYLDFFMLENTGINVNSVRWIEKEPEAFLQKSIARSRDDAPAMALSYTIYEAGGYLGWSLSRFWGVANWSSTLDHRLVKDPVDAVEIEDIIAPFNHWEKQYSPLNYRDGKDLVEVRVLSSGDCRMNGWRRYDGQEQWDRVKYWTKELTEHSIGYEILRSADIVTEDSIVKDDIPLILDSVGCVSDVQFSAITRFLSQGGTAWVTFPFGTHDEKGFKRNKPLSDKLSHHHYRNLVVINTPKGKNTLQFLIDSGLFKPVVRRLFGDPGWLARIRFYDGKPTIHFLNNALKAIPHPSLKDIGGVPVLKDITSAIKEYQLSVVVAKAIFSLQARLTLMSPEWKERKVPVEASDLGNGDVKIDLDMTGIILYAVLQ